MRFVALILLLVGCTDVKSDDDEGDGDDTGTPGLIVPPDYTDYTDYTDYYTGYTDQDMDGYSAWEDCDDTNPNVNPGMIEVDCDGLDNDCDGIVDLPRVDLDGDGITAAAGDCDDFDPDRRPGAPETANGEDDDCDGIIDEGTEFYDDDGDGFCEVFPCINGLPPGDCVDGDPLINPGMVEDLTDFFDNDCDGVLDAGTLDVDGDGYTADGADCNDNDPTVYPGATEVPDAIDNDCDGFVDEGTVLFDDDGDGYCEDPTACTDPGSLPGDCDDTTDDLFPVDLIPDGRPTHPGAVELPDWRDNNCSGTVDEGSSARDDDGDGYTEVGGDCDDSDPLDNPGIGNACGGPGAAACAPPELPNGVDDDCDGTVDEGTDWYDDDADGFAEAGGDCDDSDHLIRPGVAEVGDARDQDCDGLVDETTDRYDDDGDGYCEGPVCNDPAAPPGDCNDGDAAVNPGLSEIANNGFDDDCDGISEPVIADADGDGFQYSIDCDDQDPDTYPSAPELPDGIDNDCDGIIDEGTDLFDDDGDGYSEQSGDCDDSNPLRHPAAAEACDDIDDDCDGFF